jgi:hypothetical protein
MDHDRFEKTHSSVGGMFALLLLSQPCLQSFVVGHVTLRGLDDIQERPTTVAPHGVGVAVSMDRTAAAASLPKLLDRSAGGFQSVLSSRHVTVGTSQADSVLVPSASICASS